MLNIFYKIIAVILLALMSMILPINIGLTRDFTKGTVEINHPIISKPFKGAKSAAGYFSIKNHGAVKIIFKGISMTLAKAMLHQTTTDDDGIVKMNHIMKADIPAHEELILKPGSFHIMIVGINRPLLLGEEIPATLLFNNNLEIEIVFTVTEGATLSGSKKTEKHSH
jgi:copper(I)-binding protein